MSRQCAYCNAGLRLTAPSCARCGAPNPARRAILITAAVVAVLGPAIAIAIYAATRWEQPLIAGDRPADQPLPSRPVAGSDADFTWLSAAMKACDDKAASEPNALHFLVVPLVFEPNDLASWRRISLNRIGNALVLPGKETLDGLRSKSLSIDTEQYVFSIRDEKTQVVRKWETASGVKWLSIADAEGVASLQMQYKPHGRGRDDSWGNVVAHQKGNCYWVNAIYEE
jgi:hypothetical protein